MRKKKALIIATVGRFLNFERNDIKILKSMEYEVHCAVNLYDTSWDLQIVQGLDIVAHQIDFSRSPFTLRTIKAFRQLKKLLAEQEFSLIHCHTPVGGALGRIVARKYRKKGTKVFYTAHGFHFFTGAPLKNWLLFYPIEWLCSFWTDVLIAINTEDFERAKRRFHAKKAVYIPGVGVDTEKFRPRENGRDKIREELGFPENRIMLLSVGELNENKNHESVIRAISGMENLTYVIVGRGKLDSYLQKIAEESGVDLMLSGFRNDVADFYDAADIYILPSIREGLNVSLMEAMASSLICLAGRIRGNVDLIDESKGGYLFSPESVSQIREAVEKAVDMSSDMRSDMGRHNLQKIRKFDLQTVESIASDIYRGRVSEN